MALFFIKDDDTEKVSFVQKRVETFLTYEGRRPRILISSIGKENHNEEVKTIASFYADFGFDVDIQSLATTPQAIAKTAVENDVHFIFVVGASPDNTPLIEEMISAVKDMAGERMNTLIIGDYDESETRRLHDGGVSLVFGLQTVVTYSADKVLDILEHR